MKTVMVYVNTSAEVGDADHLPFRSAGRSAKRRRDCDVSVIGHFIHQHEFRLADANHRRAKRPAMRRPAAACGNTDPP